MFVSSIKNKLDTTSAFRLFTKSMVAFTVPPVASKSSTIKTLSPSFKASWCISNASFPYSKPYSVRIVGAGSYPGLRAIIKPAPVL